MKKIALLLIFSSLNCICQEQHWQWAVPILGDNGHTTDKIFAVATDTNSNIFVVGQFTSNNINFLDYPALANTFPTSTFESFVAKYDTEGAVVWAKKVSGSDADKANCIAVDSDGNIYVAGVFNSPSLTIGSNTLTNAGGYDIFIVKYNTDGNVIWAKREGGTADEYCNSISVNNGNVVIAGGYKSATLTIGSTILTCGLNTEEDSDILIAKYDTDGNPVWAKSWNGTAEDMANDVVIDFSGNVIFTGYFKSPAIGDGVTGLTADVGAEKSVFLIKYNSLGELFWQKKWSGGFHNEGMDLDTDDSGNIYFFTRYSGGFITFETITLSSNIFNNSVIVKYSPNGSALWANLCHPNKVNATSLALDDDHNVYVSGNMVDGLDFGISQPFQFGLGDIAIMKYNSDGSEAWAAYAGEDQYESVTKIAVDSENNVIVPGTYESAAVYFNEHTINHGVGLSDIFLAKLGTGVLGLNDVSPDSDFTLTPNPMHSKTTIYRNWAEGNVSVIITDMIGRVVIKLEFDGLELNIDRDNLPAGHYFVKITGENGDAEIKRLIIE